MRSVKEVKQSALQALDGRYWECFLVSLIQVLIGGALSVTLSIPEEADAMFGFFAFFVAVSGFLPVLFIDYPLQIGVSGYYLKNREGKTALKEMFASFQTGYLNGVCTMLLVAVKVFLWSLLFLIPGIIKGYGYAMVPYILAENPDMKARDALHLSETLMKGNKFRLFLLELSFIGWAILGIFTFGIGFIFLVPYMEAAHAEFYTELR